MSRMMILLYTSITYVLRKNIFGRVSLIVVTFFYFSLHPFTHLCDILAFCSITVESPLKTIPKSGFKRGGGHSLCEIMYAFN